MSLFSHGQFRTGFSITPQFSALEESPFQNTPSLRLAPGILLCYAPTDRLRLESGAAYSIQGQNYAMKDDPKFIDGPITLLMNYLKVPILVSWKMFRLNKIVLGLNGGVQYCRLLTAGHALFDHSGWLTSGDDLFSRCRFPKAFLDPEYNSNDVSIRFGPKAWYSLSSKVSMAALLFFERGTMAVSDDDRYDSPRTALDLKGAYNQVYGVSLEMEYAIK